MARPFCEPISARALDADNGVQVAIWQLVSEMRLRLDAERHPNGYNLGVNVGEAAGQTVAHAHVHLIPRYDGDVPDPRGGIRWLLAEKAKYWEQE